MPVYSMTGYASGQANLRSSPVEADAAGASSTRLGVEVRAVNSRFLDLSLKLPDELRAHEPMLRELLSSTLKRGKVELRAQLDDTLSASIVEPSPRLLQRLNSVQDSIQAWLPEARGLSVADVLRLQEGNPKARDDWSEPLRALAQHVIAQLNDARAREGSRLATMLQEHLASLRQLTKQAKPLVPKLVEQQQAKFLERWNEAMGLAHHPVPESVSDRALAEATAFAIRIDVAEELTRLASHLDEVDRLLREGGAVGKRLDFLMQELQREANTLGSKSAALELTRISLDMKVLIEQMREQVQNIE